MIKWRPALRLVLKGPPVGQASSDRVKLRLSGPMCSYTSWTLHNPRDRISPETMQFRFPSRKDMDGAVIQENTGPSINVHRRHFERPRYVVGNIPLVYPSSGFHLKSTIANVSRAN